MLLEHLLTALAMGIFVFLRAFQQRNVAYLNYKWVMPTSWLMALVEVGTIGVVAKQFVVYGYSFTLAFMVGTGTGLGCLAAMFLHKRYVHGRN